MAERDRLDKILHSQGYFPSRSKAKRAIMAGMVYVNGQQVDKAGTQVCTDDNFEVRGDENPFVSRGGLKLARALDVFSVDPEGQEVIDVGASTGGFTDCLLQAGASKVYAIDVGYGQLAWKIRQDERVEVIEKTNFRHLTPRELEVQVPLIVIDVSFISLRLIIPAALEFLTEGGEIIALIKPQFEAGKERVGNRGLVKDRKVHIDVLEELMSFFQQQKLTIAGLDFSPITGASSKNIEFLVHLKKMGTENNENNLDQQIRATVQAAHRKLEN